MARWIYRINKRKFVKVMKRAQGRIHKQPELTLLPGERCSEVRLRCY